MKNYNYVITHLDHSPEEGFIKVRVGGNETVGGIKPLYSLDKFNCNFSEATGIYAIYKNASNKPDDIISINHYRRRFTSSPSFGDNWIDVAARFDLPQTARARLSTSDHRYTKSRVLNATKNIHILFGQFTLVKHLKYCHDARDVDLILSFFEEEFLTYLKTHSAFYPYNMVRGRFRILGPILEQYCKKLEVVRSQLDFDRLRTPRSPAFVFERYMSFLLSFSNAGINECQVLSKK